VKISKEIKVGLLVIFSSFILYIGFNFLKGNEVFSSNNIYYTIYSNSAGLNLSNPILINGFSVGSVKDIKILKDRNYSILVVFEVKKDIIINKKTIAKLITSDLLGSRAIELIISKKGASLNNHDTILGDIEQSLKDVFISSTAPVIDDINITVRLINNFINKISNSKINLIFYNIREITSNLKSIIFINKNNINVTVSNIAKISNILANKENGISFFLSELNKSVNKLNLIFDKKNKGTLIQLIYDESIYYNFNKVLIDLDKILVDFKKNPNRYVSFSIFGKNDKNLKK
jgi:phospholipid/cholesterol/gamma-HCH transport system substrate-binding protein